MRTTRRNARTARKLYRLCLVGGLLDPSKARVVVRQVVAGRRRGSMGVLSHFQRLVTLDRDRHTAHVESATPLPDAVRISVEADIKRLFGPGVEASFTENSELIGGMRVKLGSTVYDGSVRGRLTAIAARL
jgi:F-type H+-transporting ATPase subunit delta